MIKQIFRNMVFFVVLGVLGWARAETSLEKDFMSPPDGTRPRCYWYWIKGNVSKEGITHDLEAMKRVGIGEGYIGIIEGGGTVKALTEEWWQLIEHAVREGSRLGVDVGIFNSPGWSQSGGPWVKTTQSMRYVTMPELRLHGPQRFEGKLPVPAGAFQDIAVLAFPAPEGDTNSIANHSPKISCTPEAKEVAKLFDGNPATAAGLPAGSLTVEVAEPFTARSLVIHPAGAMNVHCELMASDDGQQFRLVRKFQIDRHNLAVAVGPVPLSPISISFPEVKARFFRLAFSSACTLGEITLSSAARVESYAEKQLAKVFQDPQPPFDFYMWAKQAEPESADLVVKPVAVKNISGAMTADGTLTWEVPAGDWIVQRLAMTPTGSKNSPAPPEATGLEVDKMSRPALKAHFDAYIGKLLERVPAAERKALKHVVADSYETGPQNWTDDLALDFKTRYGYDPVPFLPVMSGRVVGSTDQSDRFLWDLRRMIADRVARDYVGGLRDLCHEKGLRMWLENYGHWGFPAEFLQYGGECDEISGEFWATGNLGSIELNDASSSAHTYGKPVVFAEAFTGGPLFTSHPGSLKARGDWAFCQGINQFVLHVYIHQPWDDRRPGMGAWFGTEFNRHNTWFEQGKTWIDYQRRCSVMLQHGNYVADVAYFIGEDAPKMAGLCKPELPAGYSFDYINAEVIEKRMDMKDGRFVLPDGMSYRLLVLPDSTTMRPALLNKIRDLVLAGGAVLGAPPVRSPSMQDYPDCDKRVQAAAAELWGSEDGKRQVGKGFVFRGDKLQPVLDQLKIQPDMDGVAGAHILYVHRKSGDADLYFLSNQSSGAQDICPVFRVDGKAPELWHADTGCIERPAVYDAGEGQVRLPIHMDPAGSVFVVFREKAGEDRIVSVTRNGVSILDTAARKATAASSAEMPGTFTLATWVRPTDRTPLFAQANRGVVGLQDNRNDVIPALHGDSFVSGGGHSGCGLAVGTNGVCVFEHGANYFAPVLVYAGPVADWTHVVVVYEGGQASLYLNGVFVHKGMKSDHIVHPSAPDPSVSARFRGETGCSETFNRALSLVEIVKLKDTMPRSAGVQTSVAVELSRAAGGRIEAQAWRAGTYEVKTAEGKTHPLAVPAVPAPVELAGPWEVRFPADSGLAEPVAFDHLTSWTDHANPLVKYFSGTAVYSKKFDLPDSLKPMAANGAMFLDLGRVEVMVEVILNGQNLGTLWKAPYRLDITSAVKSGSNAIELRVVNVWHNRLVGQAKQPDAFAAGNIFKPAVVGVGGPGAGAPLFPSGLIGPVKLMAPACVKVP